MSRLNLNYYSVRTTITLSIRIFFILSASVAIACVLANLPEQYGTLNTSEYGINYFTVLFAALTAFECTFISVLVSTISLLIAYIVRFSNRQHPAVLKVLLNIYIFSNALFRLSFCSYICIYIAPGIIEWWKQGRNLSFFIFLSLFLIPTIPIIISAVNLIRKKNVKTRFPVFFYEETDAAVYTDNSVIQYTDSFINENY